jgi:hypothetical protein
LACLDKALSELNIEALEQEGHQWLGNRSEKSVRQDGQTFWSKKSRAVMALHLWSLL